MEKSSSISVTVDYQPDSSPIYLTEWSSTGIPKLDNKLEVSEATESEQIKLTCSDQFTRVKYIGKQLKQTHERYMILAVEGDRATLSPCVLCKMQPKLDLPVRVSKGEKLALSQRLDEVDEKFGSKKSKRKIELKKKNAIAYGAEDYGTITAELQNQMQTNEKTQLPVDLNGSDSVYLDPFVMPPRNERAKKVEKVYKLFDIVPQSLIASLKLSNDLNNLEPSLSSLLVKHFASKVKDDDLSAACLFLDALIKFKLIKPRAINKVEQNGIEGVTSSELVSTLVQNYSIPSIDHGKTKRTLDDKCQDKIIIHTIILSFILNSFKPLAISALAQTLQISVIKIKRLGYIVGCHVETNDSKTEKLLNLRIPLYLMKENRYKRPKLS